MATIQEMHTSIDLEVNKINSNLYDIILPEEKDYFLNKAQERFIKQRYSAHSNPKGVGFEMSQKRIDDLRSLVVPNYYDYVYNLDSLDFDFGTKGKFYLPSDYMFLTSSRSKIIYNPCGTITSTNGDLIFKINILNLPDAEDYTSVVLTIDGETIIAANELASLSNKERTFTIQYIIDKINSSTLNVTAYSKLRNESADIVILNNDSLVVNYISDVVSLITKTYYFLTATGTVENIANRFAQQDDVYSLQSDPFNKTNILDGPLTIIHSDHIDVFYEPNNFIVNQIAISYIRKPKLMSYLFSQNCELSEETHSEIIRDAVNLMLEDFEADKRLSTSLGVQATNE